MRTIIAPLVAATLTLAAASSAVAQSKPGSDQGTSVGMASPRDAAAERDSYTQKAQGEVRIWQQKLHDYDANMRIKATAAEASTSKDLDDAWTETKTAAAKLETAGEKDWESAKASFQRASDKLAVSWHKVDPAGK